MVVETRENQVRSESAALFSRSPFSRALFCTNPKQLIQNLQISNYSM